jgi:dienelactone hydrolase
VALQDHPLVDPNNVFLVGQSNGGSVALLATGGGGSIHVNMDPNLQFKAIVAYYPWCGVPMSPLVSPLLVFGAGKDDWVSAEECERKKKFVSGKSMEVVIYPNAEHAFDLSIHSQIYEGRRVGGLKSARDDSRKRMIDFFKKHLGN